MIENNNNIDAALYGQDLFGLPNKPGSHGPLAQRFLVPPFSVLNSREGFWQDRKRAWIGLGIQSELGRGTEAVTYKIGNNKQWETSIKYGVNDHLSEEKQRALGDGTIDRAAGGTAGTSVFDPVLCELAYRWWCPPGGQVIDPFAGGSVRGVVAAMLGMKYHGCDLSEKQIEANRTQGDIICPNNIGLRWVHGDSMETAEDAPGDADFLFTCPPYGDLEKYSDNPADISGMEYHTFLAAYKLIICRWCRRLAQNRFACIVVGDFRDARGYYRNFVGNTISAFLEQGLMLYNEGVLVTAVGTLPVRVSSQFGNNRKLGKSHQNVLVFCKGDWRAAAEATNRNRKQPATPEGATEGDYTCNSR